MARDRIRTLTLVFLALGAGFLLLSSACSRAGFHASDVYRAGKDDSVTLTWETDKSGAILPKGFAHPAQVSKEEAAKILSSLNYSEYIFFKWHDKGRVFIEAEVEKLAEPVSKALAAADANQWISFAVTSYKRDLLFNSKRLTSGWIWVDGKKLHLVLGNFRFEMSQDAEPYEGDPRDRYALTTYRIEPGAFFAPPALDPKDKVFKKGHNNWTVVDLDAMRAKAQEVKTPETPKPPEARSTEERLKELKDLLDKGFITQEEYDRKRQEILEKL
jgi:hypothetical protein